MYSAQLARFQPTNVILIEGPEALADLEVRKEAIEIQGDADKLTKHAMRKIRSAQQTFVDALKADLVASLLDGKLVSVIDLRVYQT